MSAFEGTPEAKTITDKPEQAQLRVEVHIEGKSGIEAWESAL